MRNLKVGDKIQVETMPEERHGVNVFRHVFGECVGVHPYGVRVRHTVRVDGEPKRVVEYFPTKVVRRLQIFD